MKGSSKNILLEIREVIKDLCDKDEDRIAKPTAEQLIENEVRIQQLKNAHIMVCNAFDKQSEYER